MPGGEVRHPEPLEPRCVPEDGDGYARNMYIHGGAGFGAQPHSTRTSGRITL